MKYLAAFLVLNRVAVDDADLLQNRKCHQICSILLSQCSARSYYENEYPHFMFLTITKKILEFKVAKAWLIFTFVAQRLLS